MPYMLQSFSARVSVHIVDRAATTHAVADAPHGRCGVCARARARVVRGDVTDVAAVLCSAARFSRRRGRRDSVGRRAAAAVRTRTASTKTSVFAQCNKFKIKYKP